MCGEDIVDSDDSAGSSEDESTNMTVEDIQSTSTTVQTLKTELRRLGLTVRGRKVDLVKRLLDHHRIKV